MWRKPDARIPVEEADETVSAPSAGVRHKSMFKKAKKNYASGTAKFFVVCGRITEVVFEKNNVPYFGGPRYNITWEDGFFEEAVPPLELLKLYCDTPQSLGARTVLDEEITAELLKVGSGAGIIIENQKRKEAMNVLNVALNVSGLSDTVICERALDVMLGLILGAREGGVIGVGTLPPDITKALAALHAPKGASRVTKSGGESRSGRLGTPPNSATAVSFIPNVVSLVSRKASDKLVERKVHCSLGQIAAASIRSRTPNIPVVLSEGASMEWISIEIPVPDGYVWHNNDHCKTLIAYILRSKHSNRATIMVELENITEMGVKISEAIALSWAKENRRKSRKESVAKLDTMLLDLGLLSKDEIAHNVLTHIIAEHAPGVDYYVGMVQPTGKYLEYIAASPGSKMTRNRLKCNEGISFDVVEKLRTIIIRAEDVNKKKNMAVGSLVKVRYGKVYYEATIAKDRGHECYDVVYTADKKQEAAVSMSRIIPIQTAFRMKTFGEFKMPYVCVALRHREKGIGIIGFDNFNNVPSAPYDPLPETGLVSFFEHIGKVLGGVIDLTAKKASLKNVASVGKNINATQSHVFQAAFEAISQHLYFTTALSAVQIMYEEFIDPSERGVNTIVSECKLSKESVALLAGYDPVKSSYKPVQKRGSHIWLLFRIKPPDKGKEGKIFIIVIELSKPVTEPDVEYLESLQKLVLAILHNVDSRKARDHIRFESLREIKELCNDWRMYNRHYLFNEVVDLVQMCYFTANMYVGKLSEHSEYIDYVLSNKVSGMKGKRLQRLLNQGVSFKAMDSCTPLFVAQNSVLSNQLHHFGPKEQFEYPYIVIPLVAHLNSTVGVMAADSCQDISTDGEQASNAIISFFYTVASCVSKAVVGYNATDAKAELARIMFECDTFVEGIQQVKKLLLRCLPYGSKVAEIKMEPKLCSVAGNEDPADVLEKMSSRYYSSNLARIDESVVFMLRIQRVDIAVKEVTNVMVTFWWQGQQIFVYRCPDADVQNVLDAPKNFGKDRGVGPTTNSKLINGTAFRVVIPKGVLVEHVKIEMIVKGNIDGVQRDLSVGVLNYNYMVNAPMYVVSHRLISDLLPGANLGQVSFLTKVVPLDQVVAVSITGITIKDLANADTVGFSDPFVIVRWDDTEVGKTTVLDNNLNPVWKNINISMKISHSDDLLNHNLLLEVWDMDHLGRGDFLGCFFAKNHDEKMQNIFVSHSSEGEENEGDAASTVNKVVESPFYNLERHPLLPNDKQEFVQGRIKLFTSMLCAKDITDSLMYQILDVGDILESVDLDEGGDEYDFVDCELGIKWARGLILESLPEDTEELLNPFAIVYFNGEEIGKTAVVSGTSDPVWEDELITVRIRGGSSVESCELQVDVVHMTENGKGQAIGSCIVRGKQLASLLAGMKIKQQIFDVVYMGEKPVRETHQPGQLMLTGRPMSLEVEGLTHEELAVITDSLVDLGKLECKVCGVFLAPDEVGKVVENDSRADEEAPSIFIFAVFRLNDALVGKTRLFTQDEFFDSAVAHPVVAADETGTQRRQSASQNCAEFKCFERDTIVFNVPYAASLYQCKFNVEIVKRSVAVKQTKSLFGGVSAESTTSDVVLSAITLQANVEGYDIVSLLGQTGCVKRRYSLLIPATTNKFGYIEIRGGPHKAPDMISRDGRTIWLDMIGAASLSNTMNPAFRSRQREEQAISKDKLWNENVVDCYCKVYWNKTSVGESRTVRNTGFPLWTNQRFVLYPPKIEGEDESLLFCSLRIEVWSSSVPKFMASDKMGSPSAMLLGSVTLEKEALYQFLGQKTAQYSWFPIVPNPEGADEDDAFYYDESECKAVLCLRGGLAGLADDPNGVSKEELYKIEMLSASGLTKVDVFGSSDPYCVVEWCNLAVEYSRTKVVKGTVAPTFVDESVIIRRSIPGPNEDELGGGPLRFNIWNYQTDVQPDFLGCAEFSGDSLEKLFASGIPKTSMVRSAKLTADSTISATLEQREDLTDEENSMVQGTIMIKCTKMKIPPFHSPVKVFREVSLYILSASGLSIANNVTKSTDAYCTVYWTQCGVSSGEVARTVEIGRSKCVPDSLDPNFNNDRFTVSVPTNETEWKSVAIRIDVRDEHSNYFLGCYTLTGSELEKFFKSSNYDESQIADKLALPKLSVSCSYPLTTSILLPAKEQLLVGGVVTIANYPVVEVVEVVDEEQVDNDVIAEVAVTASSGEVDVDDIELRESKWNLRIHNATGLAKANTFGLSDPYVVVYWCDHKYGSTDTLSDTLDPVWDGESFILTKPFGTKLCDCSLYLEVYNYNNMVSDKFLGSMLLSENTLVEFLGEKDCGGRAKSHIFPLVPSAKFEDRGKVTPFIKGNLCISGKWLRSQPADMHDPHATILPLGLKHFEITVLAASGLSSKNSFSLGTDVFCKLHWGYNAIGSTAVVKDSTDPIWETDETFNCWVPEALGQGTAAELDVLDDEENVLYVDVFVAARLGSAEEFLGCVELRNEELLKFARAGPSGGQWFDLGFSSRRKKKDMPENIKGQIELMCRSKLVGEMAFGGKELEVNIFQAKGLPQTSAFGKTDSFVKVRWNHKIIGKTAVAKGTLSPVWESERHILHLVGSTELKACSLTLELWTWSLSGKGSFLGCVDISGDDLVELVEQNNQNQTSKWFKLGRCKYLPGKVQKLVVGQLELQCGYVGDHEHASSNMMKFELSVFEAKGLAKVDLFGLCDPFVIIKWNGKEIGKTDVISNTLDPEWKDSKFTLCIPSDMDLGEASGSSLVFEAWDHNTVSRGSFLGCLSFAGKDLEEFLAIDADFQEFYQLGFSDSMDERKQKHVQGQLSIGCKYLLSAAELSEAKHGGAVTMNWWTLRDEDAGAPVCEIRILSADGLLASKNLRGNNNVYCTVHYNNVDMGCTATCNGDDTNEHGCKPVWEHQKVYLHLPHNVDSELTRVVIELWDVSEVFSKTPTSLGRVDLTFAALFRLYDGVYTFQVMPSENGIPVRGNLTLGISFIFPHWDHMRVHTPVKYSRRIRVLSGSELPLINGVVPSTKCLIQVNGITKAQSMLVSRSNNPSFGAVYCDINVDISHEIDVHVVILHVDVKDKREVHVGEVKVPFEFLLRPPVEPWDSWLGPSRPAPAKYVFTVSGCVTLQLTANHSNENEMLPLSYFSRDYPKCSVFVTDCLDGAKQKGKPKDVVRAEGKPLSAEQRMWLGSCVDNSVATCIPSKPEWLMIPLPDMGVQIGTREKDKIGTRPGHRYALCVERPIGKAFSSDANVINDIYSSLRLCVNELRKKELYRQLRQSALRGFKNAADKYGTSLDFSVPVLLNWFVKMVFQCFPACHISIGRIKQELLSYTIYDHVDQVAVTTKSIKEMEESKKSKPRTMVLRKGQGTDWECIGKNNVKPLCIKTIEDLENRVVILDRCFRYVTFPRLVVPISTLDISMGFLNVENLGTYRGGNHKAFTDEREVLSWFKEAGTICGEGIYAGREAKALRNISNYVSHWSSTQEGLIYEIISNCMSVLSHCKLLDVWTIKPKSLQVRSVAVKKPFVPPISGIELCISQVRIVATEQGVHGHAQHMASLKRYQNRQNAEDIDSFSVGTYSTATATELIMKVQKEKIKSTFILVLGYGGVDQCMRLIESDTKNTYLSEQEIRLSITSDRNIHVTVYYIDSNMKIVEEYAGIAQLFTFKEESLTCVLSEVGSSAPLFNAEVTMVWPEKYDFLSAAGINLSSIESFSLCIKKAVGLHKISNLTAELEPDAFCEIYWGPNNKIGRTAIKKATCEPVWDESLIIPFKESQHRDYSLTLEVYHMELLGKGALLGVVEIPLDQLANPPPDSDTVEYPLSLKQGMATKKQNCVGGNLSISFSANKREDNMSVGSAKDDAHSLDEFNSTIPPAVLHMVTPAIELTVCSASNLYKANMLTGSADAFAMVFLGRSTDMLFKTKIVPKNVNPIWDETFVVNLGVEVDESLKFSDFPAIRIEVWHSTTLGQGQLLGCVELTPAWYFSRKSGLLDMGGSPLLNAKQNKYAKQGSMSLKFKVFDNEVKADKKLHFVSDLYNTMLPCFYVEVHVIRARNIGAFNRLGKKSDPYVLVKWNDEVVGQTATRKGTLDPNWNNEMFLINMSSERGYHWGEVVLQMYHQDFFTNAEFMGEVRLPPEVMLHPRQGNIDVELKPMKGQGKGKIKGTLTCKLVQKMTPQKLFVSPREYKEEAYSNVPLAPIKLNVVKDPKEEEKRQKYEKSDFPELVAKAQKLNNAYLMNPFERNGLISELHYGQLVSALQRSEHTVMKTELLDMLVIPTVSVELADSGVHTPSFASIASPELKYKKKEKMSAAEKAEVERLKQVENAADTTEVLCISARFESGQLPRRDIQFMKAVKDTLVKHIDVMRGRMSRSEQLNQLNFHTAILSKAEDIPANAMIEAIFDVEQGLDCHTEMHLLHLDGKTIVQIARDTGRPIEFAIKQPEVGGFSRGNTTAQRFAVNALITDAAKICRHGYIIQYYQNACTLVGMEWSNISQMSVVPLSSCASMIDDLEGHGFTKKFQNALEAKETSGCYMVPIFFHDEVMFGLLCIHDINKKLQHAIYRTVEIKEDNVTKTRGKATVNRENTYIKELQAPEEGVLHAMAATGHNVGAALFNNHMFTLKHGLRAMEFKPTTGPLDILRFAFRTLFCGVPALTEISVWCVDITEIPGGANHKTKKAVSRKREAKRPRNGGGLMGFLSSSPVLMDEEDTEEEEESHPICCGCFGVETSALLLGQDVSDNLQLPALIHSESKRHSTKFTSLRSNKSFFSSTDDEEDEDSSMGPSSWKVMVPTCLLPPHLMPSTDRKAPFLAATGGKKRARSTDSEENMFSKSAKMLSRSLSFTGEEKTTKNAALPLVHKEIVR